MTGALSSPEVVRAAVRALQVASRQTDKDAAASAVRGVLAALEGDDARRVAACLAVVVTHSPPAGPSDVLAWLDRLELARRMGDEVRLLNALWASGEGS